MKPRLIKPLFSLFMIVLRPASAQNPPASLNVVVLSGEGAINNVTQRALHDPSVRIEDDQQKPVSGAAVVFTLPTDGPSGEFSNGSKTLTVTTDEQGVATARGLRVNAVAGKLQIHVNASYKGLTTRMNITEFNMAVPGKTTAKSSSKKIWIILAVAAAAGGGAFAASRSGSSPATSSTTTSTPPITISPGTGTVGPPH